MRRRGTELDGGVEEASDFFFEEDLGSDLATGSLSPASAESRECFFLELLGVKIRCSILILLYLFLLAACTISFFFLSA